MQRFTESLNPKQIGYRNKMTSTNYNSQDDEQRSAGASSCSTAAVAGRGW